MLRSSFLAGSSACAAAFMPLRSMAATPELIRVATVPADSSSDMLVAQGGGFFQRNGLTPQIDSVANGNVAVSSVVSGSMDIGAINLISFAQGRERGVPLEIIALGAEYNTASATAALLVAADSGITHASDLNGKTVAVNELKGTAQVSTMAWVDMNGGDASTIKFVELPFRSVSDALAAHRIDAGFLTEPFVTMAAEGNRILGKPYDGIGPRFSISGWCCTSAWLAANLDTARRFHTAMHQAAIYANQHQSETAVIVSDATKIDLAVMKASARWLFTDQPNWAGLQKLFDAGYKFGALPTQESAKTLLTNSVLS